MQTTIPTTRIPLAEDKQGEVFTTSDAQPVMSEGARLFYIES